jgi:hypothetical protein
MHNDIDGGLPSSVLHSGYTTMSIKQSLADALGVVEPKDISPDEEMLGLESLIIDLKDGETVLGEIKRTEEIREGLIDLGNVSASIESTSIHHLALIQIASNLATAGTSASCEDLFPSLEDYNGTRVSTESLSKKANELWQRILVAIKGLIAKFSNFWTSLFGAVDVLIRSVERTAIRSKGIKGRSPKENQVTLGNERHKLEINGSLVKDGSSINKALVEAHRQLKIITVNYTDAVIHTGGKLVLSAGQTNLAPDLYLKNTIEACKGLGLSQIASLLNSRPYIDSRFSNGEVVVAPPLLGNKSLFTTTDHRVNDSSPLVSAEFSRSRRISLSASTTREYSRPTDTATIRSMSSSEIDTVCGAIKELLETVKSLSTSGTQKRLNKVNTEVLTAINNAQKSLYSVPVSESDGTRFRSASRFATSFTAWSQNPHDALCTHILSVCRAVLVVCNKSIQLHR